MEPWVDLVVGPGGTLVLLLLILVGGYKGWWVYGPTHNEIVIEKNQWRDATLKSLRAAERGVEVGEKLVEHTKKEASS